MATNLLLWSIDEASLLSTRTGCRLAMFNPINETGAMEFCRNLGFRYIHAGNDEDDVFYIDIRDKIEAGTLSLPGDAASP